MGALHARTIKVNKTPFPVFIASTASEVAVEFARRGSPSGQCVVVAIAADDWITEACTYSRKLVQVEGWTDEDIDRIIDEEREAVASKS